MDLYWKWWWDVLSFCRSMKLIWFEVGIMIKCFLLQFTGQNLNLSIGMFALWWIYRKEAKSAVDALEAYLEMRHDAVKQLQSLRVRIFNTKQTLSCSICGNTQVEIDCVYLLRFGVLGKHQLLRSVCRNADSVPVYIFSWKYTFLPYLNFWGIQMI
jgi:hypothetical protein